MECDNVGCNKTVRNDDYWKLETIDPMIGRIIKQSYCSQLCLREAVSEDWQ